MEEKKEYSRRRKMWRKMWIKKQKVTSYTMLAVISIMIVTCYPLLEGGLTLFNSKPSVVGQKITELIFAPFFISHLFWMVANKKTKQ